MRYYESGASSFLPSICYEVAFPDIFHRMALLIDPASGEIQKCDYLVNITNDAWFGTSYGPRLHRGDGAVPSGGKPHPDLPQRQYGHSLVVDPKGRILAKTDLFEVKDITAPLYTTPKVPLISKIHRYPWLIVALALLLVAASLFRKIGRPL